MAQRQRPMWAEADNIRTRVWALLSRHAKGCPGCSRYIRQPDISYTCDIGWELAKALFSVTSVRDTLRIELEAPDPRLASLF